MIKDQISLPGIKSISYFPHYRLMRNLELRAIAGMAVAVLTQKEEIPIGKNSSCECVRESDKGSIKETATLKFESTKLLPYDIRLCFEITDVNNDRWLLGVHEPPFPTISFTKSLGSPGGDRNVYQYTIKRTGIRSLIKIE